MPRAKSPRPPRKPRRRNNYCNSFRAYTDSFRANMPSDGHRRTSADVARPSSSCDTREMSIVASPPKLAKLAVQVAENKKTAIHSRRFAIHAREVTRPLRFLGTQMFRSSKRLLRHFFHRKEFRRKGNARWIVNDATRDVCACRESQEEERTSRELSLQHLLYG